MDLLSAQPSKTLGVPSLTYKYINDSLWGLDLLTYKGKQSDVLFLFGDGFQSDVVSLVVNPTAEGPTKLWRYCGLAIMTIEPPTLSAVKPLHLRLSPAWLANRTPMILISGGRREDPRGGENLDGSLDCQDVRTRGHDSYPGVADTDRVPLTSFSLVVSSGNRVGILLQTSSP